jgi:hypothetical protein
MNISTRISLTGIALAFACSAYAAPEIAGSSTVNISNNKAKNVTVAGGQGTAGKALGGLVKGAEVKMNGEANVNSLVVNDGKVKGKVNITGNDAQDVKALGGRANVNSVILGK